MQMWDWQICLDITAANQSVFLQSTWKQIIECYSSLSIIVYRRKLSQLVHVHISTRFLLQIDSGFLIFMDV